MFRIKVLLVLSLSLIMSATLAGDHSHLKVEPKGYALSTSIWPTNDIEVCWVNPEDGSEKNINLVKTWVSRTWEANSGVRFLGWDKCPVVNNRDQIRIFIDDTVPHVKALGKHIVNYDHGMVLNFEFKKWRCGHGLTSYCVRYIAIHEFGHALGFAHEQNRPDTPSSCNDAPQGTSGDIMIGSWDLVSVMNYCNPRLVYMHYLGQTDIEMVNRFYPVDRVIEDDEVDTGDGVEPDVSYDLGSLVANVINDINGDGLDDIVMLSNKGLTTKLNNGAGFDEGVVSMAFETNPLNENHSYHFVDINNDQQNDLVVFGDRGVYRSISGNDGRFSDLELMLEAFGNQTEFSSANNPRVLVDITNDGSADIVGFGQKGIYVALADNFGGFTNLGLVVSELGNAGIWDAQKNPYYLVDIDNDLNIDIVGFSDGEPVVLLGDGRGYFELSLNSNSNSYDFSNLVKRPAFK